MRGKNKSSNTTPTLTHADGCIMLFSAGGQWKTCKGKGKLMPLRSTCSVCHKNRSRDLCSTVAWSVWPNPHMAAESNLKVKCSNFKPVTNLRNCCWFASAPIWARVSKFCDLKFDVQNFYTSFPTLMGSSLAVKSFLVSTFIRMYAVSLLHFWKLAIFIYLFLV